MEQIRYFTIWVKSIHPSTESWFPCDDNKYYCRLMSVFQNNHWFHSPTNTSTVYKYLYIWVVCILYLCVFYNVKLGHCTHKFCMVELGTSCLYWKITCPEDDRVEIKLHPSPRLTLLITSSLFLLTMNYAIDGEILCLNFLELKTCLA